MNGVKIEKLAKELCEKSGCHHKCNDTKDCVVEDEAKEVIANSATTTEKQIEEMAKILCGMKNGCDGCMWDKVYCNERNYAEEIYNAGYRKQSEGEWKVTNKNGCWYYDCPFCDDGYAQKAKLPPSNYCSNCGARMRGENNG